MKSHVNVNKLIIIELVVGDGWGGEGHWLFMFQNDKGRKNLHNWAYWKCNFTMKPHICLLVGWSVGWLVGWFTVWLVRWSAGWLAGWLVSWSGGRSVCHNFLKGREVTLPCSYPSMLYYCWWIFSLQFIIRNLLRGIKPVIEKKEGDGPVSWIVPG